ncbi:MAG: hypothetical protein ACR2JC_09205 [Chloroflexota bacterium]
MSDLTSVRSARIAQAVWLVLAVMTTAVYAVPYAVTWLAMQSICHPDSACAPYQLDTASAHRLSQHGISMGEYAAFSVVVAAVVWVVWYGLGALIIWRKPRDRGALLCAFFLVSFPLLDPAFGGAIPSSARMLQFAITCMPLAALFLFGLLFPDGRFAPRWTRWLAAAGVPFTIVAALLPSSTIWIIPLFLLPFGIVGLQIYRFRSISSWAQRQQTKWALFGLSAGILGLVAEVLLSPSQNGSLANGLANTLGFSSPSLIPITIGIAVLRSRLWDIDRIIGRALVYAALSVTLATIYIGSVIGLQTVFRAISGQQSNIAVAISTLVIAALFNPLRHRIRDLIARSFYRRKYNAAHVLAAFGGTCRDETDLGKLRAGLERVVEETLQPAHVSLWLREGPGLDKR